MLNQVIFNYLREHYKIDQEESFWLSFHKIGSGIIIMTFFELSVNIFIAFINNYNINVDYADPDFLIKVHNGLDELGAIRSNT